MLLKYESVAIVQLYETDMLNENEYANILKLIQKKLFYLESDHVIGIDLLFDRGSSRLNRTYRAEAGIVEAFSIDETILQMFSSNAKM
ncbi:unnamed protein product, partial [Rotaria magnacalcarata]